MSDSRPITKSDLDDVKDLIRDESKKTREDIRDLRTQIGDEAKTNAQQEIQIQNNSEAISTLSKRLWGLLVLVLSGILTAVITALVTLFGK